MDTATHIATGSLLGFAFNQISNNASSTEIMIVAIASSIINDLDSLVKIKGNSSFIKYHRKATHLLISAPFLASFFPLLCSTIYHKENFFFLYLVSIVSILFHLALDCFNSYGTVLIRKRKPIRLNTINTFDYLFLITLLIPIGSYLLGLTNNYLLLLPFYYIFTRFIKQLIIKKTCKTKYLSNKIYVLSKYNPFIWDIIIETNVSYIVGIYSTTLKVNQTFPKKTIPDNYLSLIENSETYKSFTKLAFAYYWEVINHHDYYELKLIDLKYHRKKDCFYFKAIFYIKNNCLIKEYLGWISSDKKLYHKLA